MNRIYMVKCPDCMRKHDNHNKNWTYGHFDVKAYTCDCGTNFRTYNIRGKQSFLLKKNKKIKYWKKS